MEKWSGQASRLRARATNTFVACGDIEKGAERVVDDLMFLAARRHNVVELCLTN